MTKNLDALIFDIDVFALIWENGLILDAYYAQNNKDAYIIHVTKPTFCGLWYEIVKIGLVNHCEINVYHSKNTMILKLFTDDSDLSRYHKIVVYAEQ